MIFHYEKGDDYLTNHETGKILVGSKEAAKMLDVSLPIFYEVAATEGFPCMRVGTKILVSISGLERWVEENLGKNVLA